MIAAHIATATLIAASRLTSAEAATPVLGTLAARRRAFQYHDSYKTASSSLTGK